MPLDNMSLLKIGLCPISKEEVSLVGNYEKNSEGKLIFVGARCSVVCNLEKPLEERDESISTEVCETPDECPLYSLFSPFMG